jgi:hypothetical protein
MAKVAFLGAGSTMQGCVFEENQATGQEAGDGNGDGGAIGMAFMACMSIKDAKDGTRSVIKQNTANDGGGGVYVTYFSVLRIYKTDILNNTAVGGAGGIHVSSGSVCDVRESKVNGNSGTRGGGIHNRNSRVDVYKSEVNNNTASKRGGGIYTLCCDDSGGKFTLFGIELGWKYPESAVCPAITRIVENSKVESNTAPVAGGIEAYRAGNADPSYIVVANKILKQDILGSSVKNNVATVNNPALGLVGGVGLTGTDEAAINRPNFNRAAFTTNLTNALSLRIIVDRWDDGCGCTRAQAATYITNIMCWGQTNA